MVVEMASCVGRVRPAVEQPLEEQVEFSIDGLECRAELRGDGGREVVGERAEVGHRLLGVGSLLGGEAMAPPDLAELHRRERVHRLEGDELATETLQVAERVRLLVVGALVIDLDGLRVGQRLFVGEPELRADLLFEQLERAGRSLLLHADLRALAARLREALAGLREALLRLASGALGRERTLARDVGRARGLLRVGRGDAELLLCRAETALRVALLLDERPKARVLLGDALLGRGHLLVERVAQAHERRPALLARRRVQPRVLRALRRRGVPLDGDTLVALRPAEPLRRAPGPPLRRIPPSPPLPPPRDDPPA